MSKPPENVPPVDLFLKLCEMPRPYKVVDFPRLDQYGKPVGQLVMRVLTQNDQMAAIAAAEKVTRDILKTVPKENEARKGYDDLFKNAAAVEVLYVSCRDIKDHNRPAFPSPGEMRKHLTTDEIGVLMSNYLIVQAECGPIIAELTNEEVDAWIKVLGEGASMLPLGPLSYDTLMTLAYTLALRLYHSQMDISSVGLPPENIGTE